MTTLLHRLLRNKEGNIAVITALAAAPTIFLIGMGVDYGYAVDRKNLLDGYADAAALAAVSSNTMAQNISAAEIAGQNVFDAQASQLSGVSYQGSDLTISVSISSQNVRTATVTYDTTYNLFFPDVLGRKTMQLSGSATATSRSAPNIDFYLLLDDSPSMAIAATQSGINTMVSHTQRQGGCAFGCHESNPASDNLGNPNGEDNYALARSLGVPLRIDLLNQAAQNLMDTAVETAAVYDSTYRMGVYTFDVAFNRLQALTANLSTAKASAARIAQLEVYNNNCLTQSNCNNDEDTDFENAMRSVNSAMPDPGSGTVNNGDTPQEVLFIVTDGVIDTYASANSGYSSSYGTYCCGGRQQSTINPLGFGGTEPQVDLCAAVKDRGIRIAVLYTEYLPLPTNAWYNSKIAPFQPRIATQLQNCASPGLFYEVSTGGDISGAMAALFQTAVQSAYLAK